MRFFCAYIPLLGLNGITECFFFALMSQSEIDRSVCAGRVRCWQPVQTVLLLLHCRYNQKLLAFSALFLVSALLLTRVMGSAGFVLANCINMAVRIWHRLVLCSGVLSRCVLVNKGTLFCAAATSFRVSLRRQSSALFRLLYLRTRSWQCWPPLLSSLSSLRSEVEVCMCGRWWPCGRCACVGGVHLEVCMCGKRACVEVCVCACVCEGARAWGRCAH